MAGKTFSVAKKELDYESEEEKMVVDSQGSSGSSSRLQPASSGHVSRSCPPSLRVAPASTTSNLSRLADLATAICSSSAEANAEASHVDTPADDHSPTVAESRRVQVSRSRRSKVWDHFKSVRGGSFAICKHCGKEVSRGKVVGHFTSTGMKRHLKKYHVAIMMEDGESSMAASISASTRPSTIGSVEVPARINEGGAVKPKATVRQRQKPVRASQRNKVTPDEFKGFHTSAISKSHTSKCIQTNITRLIGQFIAVGGASFSMIEGEPFKELMAALVPQYHVPSRLTFSRKIVPSLYHSCVAAVKQELSKAAGQSVHFTTDLWAAPSGQHAFLSLTAHWWEPGACQEAVASTEEAGSSREGERVSVGQGFRSFLLHAEVMDENHPSDIILQTIRRVASLWVGVEAGNNLEMGFVVTDEAADTLKALRDENIVGVHCAAHIIHLVVKAAISEENKRVARVIECCRRIAGHFHRSVQSNNLLRQVQEMEGLPTHSLKQDVTIRWSSTLDMLERILEQQRAIHSLASDHNIDIGSPLGRDDWTVIAQLVAILKPFKHATEHLSLSTASLGDVLLVLTHLGSKMEAFIDNREVVQGGSLLPDVVTVVRKLKDNLKTHLREEMDNCPELMLACLCDPRIKGKLALKLNILSISMENLIKRVCDWQQKRGILPEEEVQQEAEMSTTLSTSSGSDTSTNTQQSRAALFWKEVLVSLEESAETHGTKESSASEMVKCYLSEAPLPQNADPLRYWDNKKSKWPAFSSVAQELLSCPPTTVQSDCVFSVTGNILKPQRSRLPPHLMEQIAFLKYNLPKLGYPALHFDCN